MYGGVGQQFLNEESKFQPKSPYAAAKLFSYEMTKNIQIPMGYLLQTEFYLIRISYRGETFVTRKITRAVGRIVAGLQSKLTLGT